MVYKALPGKTHAQSLCSAVVIMVRSRPLQQDGAHFAFNITVGNQALLQKGQEHFLAGFSDLEGKW